MKNCTSLSIVTATMVLWLSSQSLSAAGKPSQDILPDSTKFCFSIANQQDYRQRFSTTGIGKLLLDPAMQPFLDDLPRQARDESKQVPLGDLWIDLGLEPGDFDELSEGEVAWALVQTADRPSRVLIADTTDRSQQVQTLLKKIKASMTQQQAKTSARDVAGTAVTTFDIPAQGKSAARKWVYCQKDDRLIIADSAPTAELLLKNLTSATGDVLANQPGYQKVIEECQKRAGNDAPDAVLFLVPVDLSEALNKLSPQQDDRAGDGLKLARKHNFDAVSAVGCFIQVAEDPLDFHLRISVYAPKPWKNGMQICQFPNGKLVVPPWALSQAAGVTMLNFDFVNYSKHVGPLFDDTYGAGEEGLYEDLRLTLLEDPDGPKIDVNKGLFAQLSPQMTLVTRDQLPVTPDSGQRLIALPAKDEKAIAKVIKKILEFDPNTEVKQLAGHEVYYSYSEPEIDDFGNTKSRPKDQPPSYLSCVAKGHILLATDEMLPDVLQATENHSIAEDADYKQFAPYWSVLGDEICIQFFGRLQDILRVNYELLRQGKKPNEAKSFRGLLSSVASGEPIEAEPPTFDASKLPEFTKIEHYLGLSAIVGKTIENGWYLEAFVLKTESNP